MFKRNKIEVVTPWSDEEFESEKVKYKYLNRYATRKEVVLASTVPVAASIGFATHQYSLADNFSTLTPLAVNTVAQPQGVITDATLSTLAAIFDPFIEILVAISFPVASVIMAIGFFIMMFGMKEKALSMIMNAGVGYVLVQMLPLFNNILKTVGGAV